MQLLDTVAGTPVILLDDGSFCYLGPMPIDGDGCGGNPYNDPDFQDSTSYKPYGKSLNASLVPYIVLPPQIITAVPGIVLGCRAQIMNTLNGKWLEGIVGDVGPHNKLGEASIYTAQCLEIASSPVSGGTSDKIVFYRVYPGQVSQIIGSTPEAYPLQKYNQ